jgi:Tfp pilus assembly protein PilF
VLLKYQGTSEKMLEQLLQLLESGQDNAPLRFGIGSAFLKQGDAGDAVEHLAKAVELDPAFSAAWKLYGKALLKSGAEDSAADAFRKGIQVANDKGDVQAAKEMEVFLKRLLKK